jgi:hypothetical protein
MERTMKKPVITSGALSTAEEIEDVKYRIEELREELEDLEEQQLEEEEAEEEQQQEEEEETEEDDEWLAVDAETA